jgi:small subunit ribosomal protein S14
MAKKSMLARNAKRQRLSEQHKDRRAELIAVIKNPETSLEEKAECYRKLARIGRNASPVRIRNRCRVSGRPRGYISRFQMSRIALRDLGLEGKIPGLTKSSW